MPFVVKAQNSSDLSKPPAYSQVAEEEVILKGRETRSDRPRAYYHQSPKSSSSDTTLPLEETDLVSQGGGSNSKFFSDPIWKHGDSL